MQIFMNKAKSRKLMQSGAAKNRWKGWEVQKHLVKVLGISWGHYLLLSDFLNSGLGLVRYYLYRLSSCTWRHPERTFISAFSAAFQLRHAPCCSCSPPTAPAQMVGFPEEIHGPLWPGLWPKWLENQIQGTYRYLRYGPRAPVNNLWGLPKGAQWSKPVLELSVLQSREHWYFKILWRVHLRGFFHRVLIWRAPGFPCQTFY